jgi:hypothetical protein
MRRVLAVDPGVGGTGWALFSDKAWPQSVGCCTPMSSRASWVDRQASVVQKLALSVNVSATGTLVIECPELQMSERGWASARRGDLVKLALITGAIVHVFRAWDVQLVTPREWKGQLPKRVTMQIVRDSLPTRVMDDLLLERHPDHVWDAVAIGLWFLD